MKASCATCIGPRPAKVPAENALSNIDHLRELVDAWGPQPMTGEDPWPENSALFN